MRSSLANQGAVPSRQTRGGLNILDMIYMYIYNLHRKTLFNSMGYHTCIYMHMLVMMHFYV